MEEAGTQGVVGETGTLAVMGKTGTVDQTQTQEVTLMEAETQEDTSTLAITRGGQIPGLGVTMVESMAVEDTSMMAITAAEETSQGMGPTHKDFHFSLQLWD